METKSIKCGVVSVEFPLTGRAFLKSFPLDEDGALEFGLMVLDQISTGCGNVFVGSDVLPMNLVLATRNGVIVDDQNPLKA